MSEINFHPLLLGDTGSSISLDIRLWLRIITLYISQQFKKLTFMFLRKSIVVLPHFYSQTIIWILFLVVLAQWCLHSETQTCFPYLSFLQHCFICLFIWQKPSTKSRKLLFPKIKVSLCWDRRLQCSCTSASQWFYISLQLSFPCIDFCNIKKTWLHFIDIKIELSFYLKAVAAK